MSEIAVAFDSSDETGRRGRAGSRQFAGLADCD